MRPALVRLCCWETRRSGGESATAAELANDHGVIDLRLLVWICDPNADPADCFDDEPPGTPVEDLCVEADQAAIIPPGCIKVPAGPQDFFPYGVTAYIHGGELDRPLSIYRDDHSVDGSAMRIQPIANWKDDFVTGAFDDGTAADCMASAQPSCIDIQWPGERVWHGWENKDPELVQDGPRHWMGSLVYGSADASGLLYRRNRYYDPVAGQFTQEDPIGIAGGMNLYGFADGDPVNFSDPFGLNPCLIPSASPDCLAQVKATLANAADQVLVGLGKAAAFAASFFTPGPDELLVAGVLGPAVRRAGVRVLEREGAHLVGAFDAAGGEGRFVTELVQDGNDLILRGTHIEGDATLREGLDVARRLGEELGVDRVIIEGGRRTTGARRGQIPRPIILDIGNE